MKIEYYEEMLEQEAINKYLNMIANDYNGELAKIFQEKYINKDKEIERLNKELKSLQDSYDIEEEQANYHINLTDDLREEVDRLNNVINELEKDFERKIQNCTIEAETTTNDFYCRLHIATLKRWLNKIKELKESEQVTSAKEMFKKLGFIPRYDQNFNKSKIIDVVWLSKEEPYKLLVFNMERKTIWVSDNFGEMSLEELQAINKQVEELGWK